MVYFQALISLLFLGLVGSYYRKLQMEKGLHAKEAQGAARQQQYTQELIKWHRIRVRSGSVAQFLHEKSIRSLSIYGAGEMGRILGEELCREFHLQYYLDKNPNLIGESINGAQVVMPYATEGFGDAILVSVLHEADNQIRQELELLGVKTPVILLRDVLGALHVQAELLTGRPGEKKGVALAL